MKGIIHQGFLCSIGNDNVNIKIGNAKIWNG